MSIWLTMFFAGLLTYSIRLSFIKLFERMEIPPRLLRALRFVPAAVLSAIIFPEILRHEGALDLSFQNIRLLAGCLAALVAWRTKNALLTICTGMVALLLLQAFL